MPSSYYNVDLEQGQILIEESKQYVDKFFDAVPDLEDLNNITNLTKHICEFKENQKTRQRARDYFLKIGFFENGFNGEYLYLYEDGVLLLPDFIRIHKADHAQYFYATVVKINSLDYHQDPEEHQLWKKLFYKNKPEQLRIKILWGEKEVDNFIESVKGNKVRSQFGFIEYRGVGSVSALDDYELGVFNLSHGLQDIIDHFDLWFDNNTELVYSYTRHHKLTRRAVKERKDFPSPYQTIERSTLDEKEDTVAGLGQKGPDTAILQRFWWDDYNSGIIEQNMDSVVWKKYLDKQDTRNTFLHALELLGYVENRPLSPYGLLYDKLVDEDLNEYSIIPDFVRLNDKHPSAIVFISEDDKNNDEQILKYLSIANSVSSSIKIVFFYIESKSLALQELQNMQTRKDISKSSLAIKNQEWFQKQKYKSLIDLVRSTTNYYKATHYLHVKGLSHYEHDLDVIEQYKQHHQDEFLGRFLTEGISGIINDLDVDPYILSEYLYQWLKDDNIDNMTVTRNVYNYVQDINDIPFLQNHLPKTNKFNRIYRNRYENGELNDDLKTQIRKFIRNQRFREQVRTNLVEKGYFENSLDNFYGLIYFFKNGTVVIPDFVQLKPSTSFIYIQDFNMKQSEFKEIKPTITDSYTSVNMVWTGKEFEIFQSETENGTWNTNKNNVYYRGCEDAFWRVANNEQFQRLQKQYQNDFNEHLQDIASNLNESYFVVKQVNELIPFIKPNCHIDFDFPQYAMSEKGLYHSQSEVLLQEDLLNLDIIHNISDISLKQDEICFDVFGIKKMYPDFVSTDKSIVVEFDGVYYHRDPYEIDFRKTYYDYMNIECCIIWENELNDFLEHPPQSKEELIERYPCTWRNADVERGKFKTTDAGYKELYNSLKKIIQSKSTR